MGGISGYSEKEVQTIIRVHPHILGNKPRALVISESKCQTVINVKPQQEDKLCYSMLEYMPFKDIQASNIRVHDLPRKQRLHFLPNIQICMENLESCALPDDDGVCEVLSELKEKVQQACSKKSTSQDDAYTQTDPDWSEQ